MFALIYICTCRNTYILYHNTCLISILHAALIWSEKEYGTTRIVDGLIIRHISFLSSLHPNHTMSIYGVQKTRERENQIWILDETFEKLRQYCNTRVSKHKSKFPRVWLSRAAQRAAGSLEAGAGACTVEAGADPRRGSSQRWLILIFYKS